MTSAATPPVWIGFIIFVLGMLALDLGVFHRRAHVIRTREALVWTIVWIGLALAFGAGIYVWMGADKGFEFLTGYVIEKALSIDNLFVIMVILSYFAVPAELQHRVLFWGIIGALVLRAIFILAGAALLQHFHWFIYVFGGVLLITGVKLALQREGPVHPERNPVLRVMRKFIPAVADYRGSHFVVAESGRRYATPLLLVLLMKIGLALVLSFVGIKMLISGVVAIPIGVSLAVVATLVGGSIIASAPWRSAKAPGSKTGKPALDRLSGRDSRQGA